MKTVYRVDADDENIAMFVGQWDGDGWTFLALNTHPDYENQGWATHLVNLALADADREHHRVQLIAGQQDGSGATSAMMAFWNRFGFDRQGGTDDRPLMVRKARG